MKEEIEETPENDINYDILKQAVKDNQEKTAQFIDALFSHDPNVKIPNIPSVQEKHVEGEPEDHDECRKLMKNVLIARKAIRKKHPLGKDFVEGTMDCPICKTGTRWYMISDHQNGHIHSNCTTENCTQWSE
jgi:hypothetical protein